MKSELLERHGLSHYIAGFNYNFRAKIMGDAVQGEYQRAVSQLDELPQAIYSGTQVHGAQLAYCNGSTGSFDAVSGSLHFANTDGLITDKDGVALVIKYADCTPVIIFDPVKRVHASLHSGWRGTVANISLVALDKLVHEFGSQLSDLVIYLGPSIDQANYEVGREVYEAFAGFASRDEFFKPIGEKFILSNIDAIYYSLLECGIEASQIEKATESTFTDKRLHSARLEGPDYGLNAIITMMN